MVPGGGFFCLDAIERHGRFRVLRLRSNSSCLARSAGLRSVRRAALLLLFLAASSVTAGTVDGRRVVIIDGDTVAFGLERVRILNIDAPETRGAHCERELFMGLKAKERLGMLLRSGPVQIERYGQDVYGRTLARIDVNGLDVGQILVREGLALQWQDGSDAKQARRRHWCGP